MSYFYKVGYNASKYNTLESLLYTQIAIIADKYNYISLYKLIRTLFIKTVKAVKGDNWAAITNFVYNHTTIEVLAYMKLRG